MASTTATDPIAIAQALIRCRSVTPEEGGALAYLEALLAGAGFSVERPMFADPATYAVENLFATIGSGGPHFVFAGHTDVVPAGDEAGWTHPPFAGEIANGRLYGRGAVDMKGSVAAFAAAALDFLRGGGLRRGTLSFLITGDEEGQAVNGTARLLRWAADRGHRFDACVVGEPTSVQALGDAIKVGRRGSLSGTIEVTGKQGHVAYPERADNPVPRLVKLLAALTAEKLDAGSERFQPSNLEVVSVDVGNAAFNVIPARATAKFNIRFNDRWTYPTLTRWVEARLDGAGAGAYRLTYEPMTSDAFLTQSDTVIGAISAAIRSVTGKTPALSTGGGTSDARFIKDYCPVVEFGPVGTTMHQVDENIPVEELRALTRIYAKLLELAYPHQ
ncbi:MAG: succinyl-diaminopimelate desuccinylase [Bauldia sp.]|nr:succinyl-diaminopimelate desuccinylase [Bauldia sp.]